MSAKGEFVWRGLALLGFATGAAALALQLWGGAGERRETRAAAPSGPAAAPALAGRTASLSRLLSERRAVARIRLVFGAKGVLEVWCRAEAADGAQSACFGEETGSGTWSVEGASLCVAAPALGLAAPHCYALSGEAPALTLAGPGLLAGTMQLR